MHVKPASSSRDLGVGQPRRFHLVAAIAVAPNLHPHEMLGGVHIGHNAFSKLALYASFKVGQPLLMFRQRALISCR